MATPSPLNLSAPTVRRTLAPSPSLEPHSLAPESALAALVKERSHASRPHVNSPRISGTASPAGPSQSRDRRPTSSSRVRRARADTATTERTKSTLESRGSDRSAASRTSSHVGATGVRTLPPWIGSVERPFDPEQEGWNARAADGLLPKPPSRARVSTHHHSQDKQQTLRVGRRSKDGFISSDDEDTNLQSAPTGGLFSREPNRGRKWDHARENDPVILESLAGGGASEWSTFVKSSMYGPAANEEQKRVDSSYLDEMTPGYMEPWVGDRQGGDPEKALGLLNKGKRKRRRWWQRAVRSIESHPLVPLAFRLTVLTTSTIALGLSASIFHLTNRTQFAQTASAVMAIIVDVIALPYIGYITWDEYTGKPLGLRPPKAKVRLVLLDLFFIIFESANLSLAFQAITDQDGSCVAGTDRGEGMPGVSNGGERSSMVNGNLCAQEKTLAAILFVALVAWGLTFCVSIIRLVARVGGRDEQG